MSAAFLFVPVLVLIIIFSFVKTDFFDPKNTPIIITSQTHPSPTPTPKPEIILQTPPQAKTLPTNYHIMQTFNNCGPASLSMALSHYGINVSQQELAEDLRPYQVPHGNNDDKSVTLEELAEKSKDFGLLPYHRASGNMDLIKLFITYDIPVITRTWTKENEDIGHYRVVKGYDQAAGGIIQDDSLQGKNLRYKYSSFNKMWEKFNYEYLVLVPEEKKEIAEKILGEYLDPKIAWEKAIELSEAQLQENPSDTYTHYNLSIAYYNIGDFRKSVEEFEKAEPRLPLRALWYQTEPLLAYYELGNYDKIFSLTTRILNNQNRAYSEAYLLRGKIYQNQGKIDLAKQEFEKAVFYNKHFSSKVPNI